MLEGQTAGQDQQQGQPQANDGVTLPTQTSQPKSGKKVTLAAEALHGLPGEIVRTIDPYTEADPVGILTNTLVAFGNLVGRGPHFTVEETPHYTNLNTVLVGPTSKGRKGQSWSTPKRMFQEIDVDWLKKRVTSGLSSGEGLIFNVRDENPSGGDPGVKDKRLIVVEEEFSQALKLMKREGNILSQVIRDAWDGKDLHPLTKSNPITATSPHISVIGHITKDELHRHLTETEMANGFANRFLWAWVERSKIIPNPTGVPAEKLKTLTDQLKHAVQFARTVGEMHRDEGANAIWENVYPSLSEGKPGLVGAIISRAEAIVMRLACLYALTDCSSVVRPEHLKAALALWDYSEKSVKLIFGDRLGDRNVDKVKDTLKVVKRLTVTQVWKLLGRNCPKTELERIIQVLVRSGKADLKEVTNANNRKEGVLFDKP